MKTSRQTACSLQVRIARNLRERRVSLGYSQEDFADICGYHRTYIGSIERSERNITVSTLSALAEALEIDPIELLKDNG